eukprot:3208054-Rhodomonas_salina.4
MGGVVAANVFCWKPRPAHMCYSAVPPRVRLRHATCVRRWPDPVPLSRVPPLPTAGSVTPTQHHGQLPCKTLPPSSP